MNQRLIDEAIRRYTRDEIEVEELDGLLAEAVRAKPDLQHITLEAVNAILKNVYRSGNAY